jgi:hypothetical protein
MDSLQERYQEPTTPPHDEIAQWQIDPSAEIAKWRLMLGQQAPDHRADIWDRQMTLAERAIAVKMARIGSDKAGARWYDLTETDRYKIALAFQRWRQWANKWVAMEELGCRHA